MALDHHNMAMDLEKILRVANIVSYAVECGGEYFFDINCATIFIFIFRIH